MEPKSEVKISFYVEHTLTVGTGRGTTRAVMMGKTIPIDPSILEKPGALEAQVKECLSGLAKRNTMLE